MFGGIFFNIFFFACLSVFHSCHRRQEEGRTGSHLYFLCCPFKFVLAYVSPFFCLPLGEGHGSQDSEVRGKTDEDKWKVETKVVNIKMLMVL